jgi:hypothetical protein
MEALALYDNRLKSSKDKAKPSFGKGTNPFLKNDSSKSGENCPVCNSSGHKMVDCKGFLLKSARERYAAVKGFGICFHCLLGSHLIRDCKNQTSKTCGKPGCDKHHHHLLHRDDMVSCTYEDFLNSIVENTDMEVPIISDTNEVSNQIMIDMGTSVNILVCSINANDRLKRYPVITMLDMGANVICIDEDLATELKLPIISTQKKTLNYLDTSTTLISNEVQFELVSQTDLSIITLRGWTMKNLAVRTGCIDW